MPAPISPGICFGPFELDVASGELRKSGTLIKLQPQPFRVLLLLAERAGTLVTRDEIQQCLWSESTFVDFEHGINFSINQIRGALSDNAEKPRYIETLPRRGYRFIAAVRAASNGQKPAEIAEIIPDPATAAMESAPPAAIQFKSKSSTKLRWLVITASATFCVIAAALLYQYEYGRPIRAGLIEQFTRSGRIDGFQPLTTDGSRVFFLEREGDHWNNMQIAVAGGESSPFPLPFRNTIVFDLSPDHSELLIAPFSSRSGHLPLWVLPFVGGAPRRIGELSANHASFSPDGRKLVLSEDDGIYLADRDGSNLQRIAATPEGCGRVAWSPDGRLLRFTTWDRMGHRASIWEVDARGGEIRPLLPNWKGAREEWNGRWTADGAYYIFTAMGDGERGRTDLWALRKAPWFFPLSRPKPIRLTSGPIGYSDPFPSRDPRYIYSGGGLEQFDWVDVDPSSRVTKPLLPGVSATEVLFSPDRESILYVSGASLWRSKQNGSERYQLVENLVSSPVHFPRWSPDSKKIVFEGTFDGSGPIYILPADGGTRESIPAPGPQVSSPDWGPGGQRIVFSAVDQKANHSNSQRALYFHDLGSEQSSRIPGSEGLDDVRWSPDGRFLAAVAEESSTVKIYDIKKRQWSEIARGKLMAMPVWAPDSRYVYVQDILEPGEPVYRFLADHPAKERFYSFEDLLQSGVMRCGFTGFAPDGSMLVQLARGGGNLYRIQLELP
jgi:Tol biopolymer transport system component/DNA-binding winged helix-turn-helix (wHTH) protein